MFNSRVNAKKQIIFFSAIDLLGCLILGLLLINTATAGNVYLISSSNSDANQKAARLIREKLLTLNPNVHCQAISLAQLEEKTLSQHDLLVTIGSPAAKAIEQSNLNNAIIFSFTNQTPLPLIKGNWAAVVTEQPLKRLIETAQTLTINSFKKQVLIPVSAENKTVIKSALQLNLENLLLIEISETEKPAKKIDKQLFKSGAVIAVKDKHIWHGENARWMLYQAYRNNVPVIGYSKKFLKAGALASVYSTLEQIATNTAHQITDWHQHQKLQKKGIIFSNYNIEYNKKIARALNIEVPQNKFNVESEQ